LWAGTRLGRIYVSNNANAAAGSVTYTRLDQSADLPQRFPSGIAIDPANPNHAFISYSGYTEYSPGGHVYEVTFNPGAGTATATDLSADLGDQPVTDVVYAPTAHALFASTDFGVLTRSTTGGGGWVGTPGLPVVAVYGLSYDGVTHELYAATHGRSIWKISTGSLAATVTGTHVPDPSTYGSASSVNVTVAGGSGTPTGTVTVKEGATTLGTGTLSGGGTASVALPATLSAGTHSLTIEYSGDATYATASGSVTAHVNKALSTVSASAPKKVKFKKDFDVQATVSAAGGTPTGTVEVYDGKKLIGSGTLSGGTVTIHITKNLKAGKHTLTVKYLGSANVAASETTVKVKVKKKKHHH
jgi:hypothetical protein